MSKKSSYNVSDIRGASKLTVQAIVSIIDLVETVHSTVSLTKSKTEDRKGGLSGFIYWIIRGITHLVGGGVDRTLAVLEKNLITELYLSKTGKPDHNIDDTNRQIMLSIVNGVLGDYLVEKENPLAISMVLNQTIKTNSDSSLLLIHGLCMNSQQWKKNGFDYGKQISTTLGFNLFSLDYNSGKHISENGQELSEKLEELYLKKELGSELHVLAHSMGGLVIRSAVYYGENSGKSWVKILKKVVFLGTPHHGAPLEVGGNWFESLLEISDYSKPFARLGKIRSSGITDLRYGNLTDEDWKFNDRFNRSHDPRLPIPLSENIQWYAIAGTVSAESELLNASFVGDGLVPVNSALGVSRFERHQLEFPETHTLVLKGVAHLALLGNEKVYGQVLSWLKEA